ncbi:MAG: hypothetical protein MMC33_010892, partial [Icmadophila ericetorum]|nr:hypothetical protein [Icmadophila ericetorum]
MAGGNTRRRQQSNKEITPGLNDFMGGFNLAGISGDRQDRIINAAIAAMQRKSEAEAAAIASHNEPPPVPPPSSSQQPEDS